jgi:hypothetical protein
MKLSEMLMLYRNSANPNMQAIAAEFADLSASEQRELLFWMVVDASTNPTNVRSEHARKQ